MDIVLIVYTVMVFIGTMIFIGKFFCIHAFEHLYDSIEQECSDVFVGYIITYCCGLLLLIAAWFVHVMHWGYIREDPILGVILVVFGLAFSFVNNTMTIFYACSEVVFPWLSDIHHNIKRRKRG